MKKIVKLKSSNKRENINCFLYACLISVSHIGQMVYQIVKKPYILFFLLWGIVFAFLLNNRKIRIKYYPILFIFIITIIFIISIMNNGEYAIRYFRYFISYVSPAILLNSIDNMNYKMIEKYTNIIFFIYIMFYIILYRNIFLNSSDYATLQMEVGYCFLPIIILSFIDLKYYKTKYKGVLSLFNIIMSTWFLLIDCSSRGPIVGIFTFFVFLLFTNANGWKKILFISITVTLIVIIWINFENIIMFIYNILEVNEISFPLIDKMILWIRANYAMGNGRADLYRRALYHVQNEIFLGGGIGSFEKYNFRTTGSGGYVHQYFIQVLCEFGIIGLIGAILIVVNEIRYLFFLPHTNEQEKLLFGLFLMSCCLPQLMFSGSFWLSSFFWIFTAWFVFNKHRSLIKDGERII